MSNKKLINEIVKKIRIESGIKQKDARRNVMSADAYSRIENGKKEISWNELIGILENLNISLSEFVSIYGEPILTHGLREKVRMLYYEIDSVEAQEQLIAIYEQLEQTCSELQSCEKSVYFDIKQIFHQKFPKKINPITKKELQEVVSLVKKKKGKQFFDEDYRLISQTILDMDKEDMELVLDSLFPLEQKNITDYREKREAASIPKCIQDQVISSDYAKQIFVPVDFKIVEHELENQPAYIEGQSAYTHVEKYLRETFVTVKLKWSIIEPKSLSVQECVLENDSSVTLEESGERG